MKIEEYCKEKGYGISEVYLKQGHDLDEEFITGLIKKPHKKYEETEIRKAVEVEKIIVPSETGKKIVFTKDWNRLCHLSSLFLEGDFYLAIDGHSDMIKKEPWRPKTYGCGNYRNLILKQCKKDNTKLFLITTENFEEQKHLRCEEEYEPYLTCERLYRSISMDHLKEKINKNIKGKKGVVCLDYDILLPEETKIYNLDEMYTKDAGINFSELKEIIKTILDNAGVRTFFITVPYKRKDFLEDLLQ